MDTNAILAAAACVNATVGVATATTLAFQYRATRFAQRTLVLIECNRTFRDITSQPSLLGRAWHGRFWSHQADQFQHWQNGDIRTSTYRSWMRARQVEWNRNEIIGGVSVRDGWKKFASQCTDIDFVKFFDALIVKGNFDAEMERWAPGKRRAA